jgi:nitrogen fixation protein FixH
MNMTEAHTNDGKKIFTIIIICFFTILSVNVFFLLMAISTFPGLEQSNAYVVGRKFNALEKGQLSLGWKAKISADSNELSVRIVDRQDKLVTAKSMILTVGLSGSNKYDQHFALSKGALAEFPIILIGPGKWRIHVRGTSENEILFLQRLTIEIPYV